jgi:hypothetical protein
MQLQFTPGYLPIHLRELTGRDELELYGTGTETAIWLIQQLIVDLEGDTANSVKKADTLVTADRDRLLAYIYKKSYGPRINSRLYCINCRERFELDFLIDDLIVFQKPDKGYTATLSNNDGTYRLDEQCKFRLPTGADELTTGCLPPENAAMALLELCLQAGDPVTDADRVQLAMAQIAPILQTEMAVQCPECGTGQEAKFDMQSFLLSKIKKEQSSVLKDVHRLASTYQWSHQEILDLPRHLRRTYVAMIESEMEK